MANYVCMYVCNYGWVSASQSVMSVSDCCPSILTFISTSGDIEQATRS